MSAKPTVATLAATVEQMAAKISALESQIEGASDGIAVQLVSNLIEQRLQALLDKVAQLEATVSAQATEIERAHARLDSARDYLRTMRKSPAAPARRAQQPQGAVQERPPVPPKPGLQVYTHTQGLRKGQSFQYWKEGNTTSMIRVFGPGDDVTTGLPKAPAVIPDDLPPPQAAEPEPELVCPF